MQATHAIAAAEAARQEVRRSHAAVRPFLAQLGEPYVAIHLAYRALPSLHSTSAVSVGPELASLCQWIFQDASSAEGRMKLCFIVAGGA